MWRIVIPQNTDIVFSPDGKFMAVSGEENFVRIWNVSSWTEIPHLKHEHKVCALAFSPDGRYLVTTSSDKTAVWETLHFQEVARLTYNDDIKAVTFSPDGRYLATASAKGDVEVWLWQPNDLVDEACRRLTQNLTHDEWFQYLGNEPYEKTCPFVNGRKP